MPTKTNAAPTGYHTVTPYLVLENAAAAIDFYKKAFGAEEYLRLEHDGRVAHAEIRIGDSPVMLADSTPDMGYRGPRSFGGTPVSMMVYVGDVDTVFNRAIAAGAEPLRPVQDQFYGDRTGTLTDPFGHIWSIGTPKEKLAPEEMRRRFEELMATQGKA
jgi:PhnB protein